MDKVQWYKSNTNENCNTYKECCINKYGIRFKSLFSQHYNLQDMNFVFVGKQDNNIVLKFSQTKDGPGYPFKIGKCHGAYMISCVTFIGQFQNILDGYYPVECVDETTFKIKLEA